MPKANRNRSAGHTWERDIVKLLNHFEFILPETGTARELSQYYDKNKVDIVTKVIQEMEELGLAIQAKTKTTVVSYPKLLNELNDRLETKLKLKSIPVVFHKQTEKVGNRFMPRGKYACLDLYNFLKIFLHMYCYKQGFKLLETYFDSIPDEDKKSVQSKLQKLGL